MNVTKKCIISGKHGFQLINSNRFAVIEVKAGNGDIIKVNKVNGIKFNEIWTAYENPRHEEHPVTDNQNKIIIVGGKEKESNRTIWVIGK